MRAKTIIIIILIILIAMVILQFIYNANFTLIFDDVPKWEMMIFAVVLAFILGVIIARPGKSHPVRNFGTDDRDDEDNTDTLSDEDREYIK